MLCLCLLFQFFGIVFSFRNCIKCFLFDFICMLLQKKQGKQRYLKYCCRNFNFSIEENRTCSLEANKKRRMKKFLPSAGHLLKKVRKSYALDIKTTDKNHSKIVVKLQQRNILLCKPNEQTAKKRFIVFHLTLCCF